MRGVVRRAELLCPPTGETLALVAAGEKRELLWVGFTQRLEPGYSRFQRLVPGNLFEFTRSARTNPTQWRAQPCGRIMLHDPRRSLGAQDAAIDGVVAISFDISDLSIAQMNVDPATAGAHVAGRLADFVGHIRCKINLAFRHSAGPPFPSICATGPIAMYLSMRLIICVAICHPLPALWRSCYHGPKRSCRNVRTRGTCHPISAGKRSGQGLSAPRPSTPPRNCPQPWPSCPRRPRWRGI